MTQLVNVLEDELAGCLITLKKLIEEGSTDGVALGNGAEHFNHLGKVVIRLAVVLSFPWVEEEVSRDELECHACERPQVRAHVVVKSKHNFGASILASLNLLREVMVSQAAISQVTDLEGDVFISQRTSFMHIFSRHLLL